MNATYQLTTDEAAGILRAVFEYNGKEASEVTFLDTHGKPVEVSAVAITCSADPLRIRVVPEHEDPNDPVSIVRRVSEMPIPGLTGNGK